MEGLEKLKEEIAGKLNICVTLGWDIADSEIRATLASEILTLFQDWLKKNNYVQLSPDQRLPLSGPYSLREAHIVRQARQDMLNDKFRRVELPAKQPDKI